MNTDKEWRVYLNGRWVGYARAASSEDAIIKVQAKHPHSGRWTAY